MDTKWYALLLVGLVLLSITITRVGGDSVEVSDLSNASREGAALSVATSSLSPNLAFQRASLIEAPIEVKKGPVRNWDVLDPHVRAEAVLIQSLEDGYPFFHLNTYKTWPAASLTKLLTALIVLEDIGENKKIPIDEKIVATEGKAGGLKSGEVYSARDLLKIMLLASSNDAAVAFESYLGTEKFVRLLNKKARRVGMTQTLFYDGSGLSDLNHSTASDLLRLTRYILEHEPEIFNITRLPSTLIQPINDVTSRTVYNINNLVDTDYFLGGKTGTSDKAQQNLLTIVSLGEKRLIAILLGSPDRNGELESLLRWINKAYEF